MNVLVTGANGFLGSHIVKELNKQGCGVRAFMLNHTSDDIIQGLKYESYYGDLTNADDIDAALQGCDYLIHTAAVTDVWPTKNEISWKINYSVVKQLVEGVKKHKVKKYIHVGTANSFGFGTLEAPGTENTSFNGDKYRLDYINSKKTAQDYLLSQVKESNLPVVIINPSFMIGSNDQKPGTGEMILSVIHNKVPGYAKGGRCFAAVNDVAKACVSAIDKGQVGECYITGGTNMCYKDFFELIATKAHVKAPKRYIPTSIAIVFAGCLELIAKLRKKQPLLTVAMARISGDGHYYSSQKAIDELDYPQTPLEVALEEAITWYQENGYIEERST